MTAAPLALNTPAAPGARPAWMDSYFAPTDHTPLAMRPLSRLWGFEDGRRVSADDTELLHLGFTLTPPVCHAGGGSAQTWRELLLWSSATVGHPDGRLVRLHIGVGTPVNSDTRGFIARWQRHRARNSVRWYQNLDRLLNAELRLMSRLLYRDDPIWQITSGWDVHPGYLSISRRLHDILTGDARGVAPDALQPLAAEPQPATTAAPEHTI